MHTTYYDMESVCPTIAGLPRQGRAILVLTNPKPEKRARHQVNAPRPQLLRQTDPATEDTLRRQ